MGTSLFYKRLGRGDGAVLYLLIFSSLFYFDPCDCVFLFVSVFVYLILVQREKEIPLYINCDILSVQLNNVSMVMP